MVACASAPSSTRKYYIAVKQQADENTPIKPTHYLPSLSGTINKSKTNLYSKSKLGIRNMNGESVVGPEEVSGEINTELSANYAPYFLLGAFGSLTSTDVSSLTDASVYRHRFTTAFCRPSFTVDEAIGNYDDTTNNYQNFIVKRSYGVKFGDITLTATQNELLKMTSTVMAKGQFEQTRLVSDAAAGAAVNVALQTVEGLTTSDTVILYDETPQSETDAVASISTANKTIQIATLGNTYTTANKAKVELLSGAVSFSPAEERLMSGVQFVVRRGEDITAAQTADQVCITSLTLNFPNADEAIACLGKAGTAAAGIVGKGQDITVTFDATFRNKYYRNKFLNAENFALFISARNGIQISATDTNQEQYGFDLYLPKVSIETDEIPNDEDAIWTETITAKILYDASEGYDIRLDLFNGLAGTQYTA